MRPPKSSRPEGVGTRACPWRASIWDHAASSPDVAQRARPSAVGTMLHRSPTPVPPPPSPPATTSWPSHTAAACCRRGGGSGASADGTRAHRCSADAVSSILSSRAPPAASSALSEPSGPGVRSSPPKSSNEELPSQVVVWPQELLGVSSVAWSCAQPISHSRAKSQKRDARLGSQNNTNSPTGRNIARYARATLLKMP
jgi:hypothetical protein